MAVCIAVSDGAQEDMTMPARRSAAGIQVRFMIPPDAKKAKALA
jgi:hypothetical protein